MNRFTRFCLIGLFLMIQIGSLAQNQSAGVSDPAIRVYAPLPLIGIGISGNRRAAIGDAFAAILMLPVEFWHC